MAIIAEVEERLLHLTDFEDIITCLKSDPAQWADDKLRGILTAAYLSSVSEEELTLASESVTAAAAESMLAGATAALASSDASGEGVPGEGVGSGDGGGGAGARAEGDGPAAAPARAGAAAAGAQGQATAAVGHRRATSNAEALDQLVRSELTHLTWAEAAAEGDSPTASESAAGAEALMKSLWRAPDGAAKGSPARRKSIGPVHEVAGEGAPVAGSGAAATGAMNRHTEATLPGTGAQSPR